MQKYISFVSIGIICMLCSCNNTSNVKTRNDITAFNDVSNNTQVITRSTNGEIHEYVYISVDEHDYISHLPNCKYCTRNSSEYPYCNPEGNPDGF